MNFYKKSEISQKAADLIQFDQDSIRQVAAGERRPIPEFWLVDPEEYEKNGRVHRDSSTPRMLAYSSQDQILYATDGCNSCARRLSGPLNKLSETEIHSFARDNELRVDLLKHLVSLLN